MSKAFLFGFAVSFFRKLSGLFESVSVRVQLCGGATGSGELSWAIKDRSLSAASKRGLTLTKLCACSVIEINEKLRQWFLRQLNHFQDQLVVPSTSLAVTNVLIWGAWGRLLVGMSVTASTSKFWCQRVSLSSGTFMSGLYEAKNSYLSLETFIKSLE